MPRHAAICKLTALSRGKRHKDGECEFNKALSTPSCVEAMQVHEVPQQGVRHHMLRGLLVEGRRGAPEVSGVAPGHDVREAQGLGHLTARGLLSSPPAPPA